MRKIVAPIGVYEGLQSLLHESFFSQDRQTDNPSKQPVQTALLSMLTDKD